MDFVQEITRGGKSFPPYWRNLQTAIHAVTVCQTHCSETTLLMQLTPGSSRIDRDLLGPVPNQYKVFLLKSQSIRRAQ